MIKAFGKWARMKFLCEIEKDVEGNEYVASCEELRAVASGATEEEALSNLVIAIKRLLREYGEEIDLSRRKRVVVEVM